MVTDSWTYYISSRSGEFLDQLQSPFNNYNNKPILHLITLSSLLLLLSYYVYKDYQFFLSLGAGGTPSTFRGYLWVTFLRLFALHDPYSPPGNLPPSDKKKGYFQIANYSLPSRPGPRPEVGGIAPQRQLTQKGPSETFSLLSDAIKAIAKNNPETLTLGTSCFEKHGTGLFSMDPIQHTCKGEICHVHPSDGSLHMVLHPADIKVLLEAGWGERHPLSRGGWLKRLSAVPGEFVMVYAPRDKEEVDVVMTVVKAAVWWVNARRI